MPPTSSTTSETPPCGVVKSKGCGDLRRPTRKVVLHEADDVLRADLRLEQNSVRPDTVFLEQRRPVEVRDPVATALREDRLELEYFILHIHF